MSNIITIGIAREGTTDERFLEHIIQRTFEEIAFECEGEIEVYSPVCFKYPPGTFIEKVLKLSQTAHEQGLMVLCVHTDADSATDRTAFDFRIKPAFDEVEASRNQICKNLVAVVPIQETEAWMLADKEVFKKEIGINSNENFSDLHKIPESVARPKEYIENIIRKNVEATQIKKQYQIKISDLYTPLGQKIDLKYLRKLTSYLKFEEQVRGAYRKLNYLN